MNDTARCYQCDRPTAYLFPDSRCGDCTRLTPEEVAGGAIHALSREEKWDRRYVELARLVGQWSKDPSTKVGAVLVRPNNSVAATGFNGFPSGHNDSAALYNDRAYKYAHVIHAEVNALAFHGQPADGFTLYTSFPCCPDCVAVAGAAGVRRIVSPPLPREGRERAWIEEWERRLAVSVLIAHRHGIVMEAVDV